MEIDHNGEEFKEIETMFLKTSPNLKIKSIKRL